MMLMTVINIGYRLYRIASHQISWSRFETPVRIQESRFEIWLKSPSGLARTPTPLPFSVEDRSSRAWNAHTVVAY